MQISPSVPSPSPSETTGSGGDALFEEVATTGSDDPTDSEAAGGFAAMIQAVLATATQLAPIPVDLAAASQGQRAHSDSGSNPTGDSLRAGTANARTEMTESAGGTTSPADSADSPAALQGETRAPGFVDQQDAVDALIARGATFVEQPGSGESHISVGDAASEVSLIEDIDGHPTDNVMLAVEQAMESFTPIPASVLALMRAGSADGDSASAAMPISGASEQRTRAIDALSNDAYADDLEAFGADGDPSLALMPAIEFATTRAADHVSVADAGSDVDERTGNPSANPSGESDLAASQLQPGGSLRGETPLGGRDHALAIPATGEAIGAFAIEQIVTRASGEADQPVSRIEARIDPPELGRISIEISRSPEGLTAHLTVEDSSVLALLDQQMKEVRQTLEAAGVPMASLTMSMSSGDDAPREHTERDDEALTFATPTRPGRSVGGRPAGASRREIDTTA